MFGFIHKFPYSNFHEINLDWIISEVKKLREEFAGVKKEIDDAVIYMKDNIVETTETIINEAISRGEIQVGVIYTPETERLDIIGSE